MFDFVKMHGLGNDYVYLDGFRQSLDGIDPAALARAISDRHRGVGSDGLILIVPPQPGTHADVRMIMFNADGSRGEMCGNGIRCVAKYAVENGLVMERREEKNQNVETSERQLDGAQRHSAVTVHVQTDRGVLELTAYLDTAGLVGRVRVNMGPPVLLPRDIPVKVSGERCVRQPIEVGGRRFSMTCVSMGNPHAVFFVDDVADIELEMIGPQIERHALFPNRVNVHLAQIRSPGEATMRTWERGAGITQACGTGACAVLVAGVLEDRLQRAALIHLPGGDLEIEWADDKHGGDVFKTGPAVEVFRGQWRMANGE